jgi:hypothetical protein
MNSGSDVSIARVVPGKLKMTSGKKLNGSVYFSVP